MHSLPSAIFDRIHHGPRSVVWTASDFVDLGSRSAVDTTLHRLSASAKLRRIDRGLYDLPRVNPLTAKPAAPDPHAVINAVARRDQARVLIDGIVAANDLGLTNAVPGQIIVRTDGRLSPIRLGNMMIVFKLTSPSGLYWAGRPAGRIVQALKWLGQDIVTADADRIAATIGRAHKTLDRQSVITDLQQGLSVLPAWMHVPVKTIVDRLRADDDQGSFALTADTSTKPGARRRDAALMLETQ